MLLVASKAGAETVLGDCGGKRLRLRVGTCIHDDRPQCRSGSVASHWAVLIVSVALMLGANTSSAQANGNLAAGRQKALQCQTCHGLDGSSKIPDAPNLAGQVEHYLVKALDDYKSGARKNEMMSLVAPVLTEQDIDDLAAYYAAIEVTVTPPK
jgi:cytochrome c553